MARMTEETCTHALGSYKDKGFSAYESDDHTLVIEHYGETIARLNATKATIDEIQHVCHQHLNEDILLRRHSYPRPHRG